MRLGTPVRGRSCRVLEASGKRVDFIRGVVDSHWRDVRTEGFVFLKGDRGFGINEGLFPYKQMLSTDNLMVDT